MYAKAKQKGARVCRGISLTVYVQLLFSPFGYFRIAPAIHYFFLIVLAQAAITAGFFLAAHSYRT